MRLRSVNGSQTGHGDRRGRLGTIGVVGGGNRTECFTAEKEAGGQGGTGSDAPSAFF